MVGPNPTIEGRIISDHNLCSDFILPSMVGFGPTIIYARIIFYLYEGRIRLSDFYLWSSDRLLPYMVRQSSTIYALITFYHICSDYFLPYMVGSNYSWSFTSFYHIWSDQVAFTLHGRTKFYHICSDYLLPYMLGLSSTIYGRIKLFNKFY